MKPITLLAVGSALVGPCLGFAPPPPSLSPPPRHGVAARHRHPNGASERNGGVVIASRPRRSAPTSTTATKLRAAAPEPLATEGDWCAYVDDETTGYVYYFNSATGESTWERPTDTFPSVDAASAAASSGGVTGPGADDREARREERRAERQRRREEKRREEEERRAAVAAEAAAQPVAAPAEEGGGEPSPATGGGGGGFFGSLFGGGKGKSSPPPERGASGGGKMEALSDLQDMASNDDFLSELDTVIAEANEAIAIADKIDESPPKNKGGFFSSLGFVSGKEAIEEAETLLEDAEERTSKVNSVFSQFAFGARASPKVERKPDPVEEDVADEPGLWVEGLKGLFAKSFASFIEPQTTTKAPDGRGEKKVVATTEPREQKAEVSDSDFLDVVWGAETSARPTLNIAEMMKAFQVQSKDEGAVAVREDASEEFRTLTLDAALHVKPHPEKVSWGGEDAGFTVGRTFGVFDGVSGAEKTKGKKLYSRSLADSMKRTSSKGGMSVKEIQECMLEAKELADEVATGASTAVVASIGEDNVLRAVNLGDSVCLVLRDGAVAARTREIIHFFDCPFQLGDDSPDRPKDATTLQSEIFKGDVVVAGSDGVFDNLSDADVCEIVSSFGPRTKSAAIAKKIVERSRAVSLDLDAVTPYSTVARGKKGYEEYRNGRGGKVDDISCIVVKAS